MIAEYITAADVREAEAAWKGASRATEEAWQAVDLARALAEQVEASAEAARERYERLRYQVGYRRSA